MRDPFEVLGLSAGASDEQVRNAYRDLARRYSEGGENPNPRRMREIDEAYDAIILSRTGNGSSNSSYNSGYNTYTQDSYADSGLGDVRAKINSGKLEEAEILLDGIPSSRRSAEWYYLKGTVQHRKGWLEDAAQNFAYASQLDPSNAEYKRACQSINSDRAGGYRTERRTEKSSSCSSCDICSGLLCADCCCECMGGDCIPCC